MEPGRPVEAEIRCYDCLGSGVAGDGAIARYATPHLLLLVGCPVCLVDPGDRCRTGYREDDYEPTLLADGDTERYVHRARSRAAVAAYLSRSVLQRAA